MDATPAILMLPERTSKENLPAPVRGKTLFWPWLFLLAASALAASILPRPNPFPYSYELDRLWLYNDLKAPSEVYFNARDGSAPPTLPAYEFLPKKAQEARAAFLQTLENQAKTSKMDAEYDDFNARLPAYRNYGNRLIDQAYRTGIVDQLPDTARFDSAFMGRPFPRTVALSELVTLRLVLDEMTDSLPYSPLRQPELLYPMLEKALAPNYLLTERQVTGGPEMKLLEGQLVVKHGQKIDVQILAQLEAIKDTVKPKNRIMVWAGYFLFCLVGFGSMFGWLFTRHQELLASQKQLGLLLGAILATLVAIDFCYHIAPAVPLLVPLFLIPLMASQAFGLKSAIVLWSIPVLLSGFSMEWGMAWVAIQTAGAGMALMLNNWVESWGDRIKALLLVFGSQVLVWLAAYMADKLPETLKTTDTVFFLAIAALLAISRSLFTRFFQITVNNR